MGRVSAVYVTGGICVFDGQTASLGTLLEGGLPGLLHRLSQATCFGRSSTDPSAGEGTVLIDGTACAALGLPYSAPTTPGARRLADNALNQAREAGWAVSGVSPWMTFWRPPAPGARRPDRATVHVGMVPWIPLPGDTPGKKTRSPEIFMYHNGEVFDGWQTTARMAEWAHRTRCAYRMTPGVSLLSQIRQSWSPAKRGDTHPTWKMIDPPPPALVSGTDRGFGSWQSPQPSPGPRYYAYDGNLAYLGSMGVTEVSKGHLTFAGAPRFDPASPRHGYWLIKAPSWNHTRIPHPAGPVRPGDEVWVTTPTMVLLRQLQDQGVVEFPQVIQGWLSTGPAVRPFRTMAGRLSAAIADLATYPEDDGDARAVLDTLKHGYQQAWGLLNDPQCLTYRPDWHHAIQAQHRVNLWRRMWKIAMRDDRWPVAINVDEVWYGSALTNAKDASPLEIRAGAGGFKCTKSADDLPGVIACLTQRAA